MPNQIRIITVQKGAKALSDQDGNQLTPPTNWQLLPPGDAALTRRVKKAGPHWLVREKKGRRTFSKGVWADGEIISREKKKLDTERAKPEYSRRIEAGRQRREKQQQQYVQDFEKTVLSYLKFHPDHTELAEKLAKAVTKHATPVGSGTVARASSVSLEKKAEAAVIAWLRHQTTHYDRMTIARVKGRRRQVRRELAQRSVLLLDKYRNPAGDDLPSCPLRKALYSI